jgi:hypothetical protein
VVIRDKSSLAVLKKWVLNMKNIYHIHGGTNNLIKKVKMKHLFVGIMALLIASTCYAHQSHNKSYYSATMTGGVQVGSHMLDRGLSTGGGNGDYIKYGYNETKDWCERLLKRNAPNLSLGHDVKYIQYKGQMCYYYGDVKDKRRPNAGKSGPYTWTYKPTQLSVDTHCSINVELVNSTLNGHYPQEKIVKWGAKRLQVCLQQVNRFGMHTELLYDGNNKTWWDRAKAPHGWLIP